MIFLISNLLIENDTPSPLLPYKIHWLKESFFLLKEPINILLLFESVSFTLLITSYISIALNRLYSLINSLITFKPKDTSCGSFKYE